MDRNGYRYATQEEAEWLRSDGRTAPPAMTRKAFFELPPRDQYALAKAGLIPSEDEKVKVVLQEGQISRRQFDALSQAEQYAASRSKVIVDVD